MSKDQKAENGSNEEKSIIDAYRKITATHAKVRVLVLGINENHAAEIQRVQLHYVDGVMQTFRGEEVAVV